LVFIAFFSICFGILTFLVLTGSAAFSGICGLVRELNQNQVHELYRFKDLDNNVIQFAETCIFSNSTGDLFELFSTDNNFNDHQK